jgi:pyruvate,water dikinase
VGFPVPPGFVVTTRAYTEFVAAAGLGPAIASLAGSGPAAAATLRGLFAAAAFPGQLRSEIAEAHARLAAPAVRPGDVALPTVNGYAY